MIKRYVLIYVIALDKIYTLYQYLFGIRMCSILAKCWKSSEMAKIAFSLVLLILLNLSPNKSPCNKYYPNSVPNPDIVIILLPRNDKTVVLAKNFIFDYFSYLSNVNQLH